MKNGVECYKDFFPYFKALKTNCDRKVLVSMHLLTHVLDRDTWVLAFYLVS